MKTNPLYLFIACCLVPLILAYTALKLDWLPSAASNHGEFLKQEIKIEHWQDTPKKQWTIALNYPADCSQICRQQLATLDNLQIALGKNQQKVDVALVVDTPLQQQPWSQLTANKALVAPGDLYLIDHMGLVVLRYPFVADPQQNRLMQKGLLKDIKKLLNYSRSS